MEEFIKLHKEKIFAIGEVKYHKVDDVFEVENMKAN